MTSRIRLARNIRGFPFPHRTTMESKEALTSRVEVLLPDLNGSSGKEWQLVRMNSLKSNLRGILLDKHLVSPQLVHNPDGASLLLSSDEEVAIMLNEEDHLRLQVLLPGEQLNASWETATRIDDILENELDYAFASDLGYLTACPTNVGTGLRASVMAHLPALAISKKIPRLLTAINQMGFVVRGIYGEGSEAAGQVYQISNQVSLGSAEGEVLQSLQAIVKQVVDEERNTRRSLQNSTEQELIDRIGRSIGTLKNARLMDTAEAMQLLSDLRLGINLQRVYGIDCQTVSILLVKIQPSWLSVEYPQENASLAWQRAAVLREALSQTSID
ncbi:MAG: protein arginine kinase [Symbiobacteriaceae bacterium]|nr:protein arginine kinase [Symbiobacteriaceae bacterium]